MVKKSIFLISLLLPLLGFCQKSPTAYLLEINGAIGPASADHIIRGIHQAEEKHAACFILQMDTPGGLDKSMRAIIKTILNSNIPIITYVAPAGARAASAGTYILYASHIAAMAPGTNLGAATPVQIMGSQSDKKEKNGQINTMKAKMLNDAIAYIKSLADLRGRNAQWAELAVREAASLTAKEALEKNVINIIANNADNLLKQANQMTVQVRGKKVQLNTDNITIHRIQPDWRYKLLSVITDPSVAYILLLIGIYGLFFEFANPGFVVPGVIGAIALLLALYAFQLLPINYAGLGLIILGLAFLAAEAFMPSFGVLGIGGIIAFIAGSILLFDTKLPAFAINWWLIIMMALLNAAFFIGVIGMAIRARTRQPVSGREELIHKEGKALEDFSHEGWIRIHSERWKARTDTPIKKDQTVVVEAIDGLNLIIKPKNGAT